MEYFISELEKSLAVDLPLLSLAGAFILIDSISARNTENGIASGSKFKNWIEAYLPSYLSMGISGDDWYKFRCVLLHQLLAQMILPQFPLSCSSLKAGQFKRT